MRVGKQRGFGYLALLAALAVLSIVLFKLTGEWRVRERRDQEAQLLFAGDQIRAAIDRYFNGGPVSGCYPLELETLLDDRRERAGGGLWASSGSTDAPMPAGNAATGRGAALLRRLYRDPLTNAARWGEIRNKGGGLVGVYSLGSGRPFKQDNFADADADFVGKNSYSEWRFVHQPRTPPAPAGSCVGLTDGGRFVRPD